MKTSTMIEIRDGGQAIAVDPSMRGGFRSAVNQLERSCFCGESNAEADSSCKIEHSIAYMKQNLDKPLHVSALAGQINVSPSHYFALFKRHTGCAPIDFFTRLRIQRACLLLDSTLLSVKEIASALGYDDPFYFSRVFKSTNLVSPSDFRKAHKNGNGDNPMVENQVSGSNGFDKPAKPAAKNGQSSAMRIVQNGGSQGGDWKTSSPEIMSLSCAK